MIYWLSKQIWDVEPMLVLCWASVVDGSPTENQYWINILGISWFWIHLHVMFILGVCHLHKHTRHIWPRAIILAKAKDNICRGVPVAEMSLWQRCPCGGDESQSMTDESYCAAANVSDRHLIICHNLNHQSIQSDQLSDARKCSVISFDEDCDCMMMFWY